MDLQLADTPCLVTGASTGIGAAIAAALAAEGARVAITARRLELLDRVADAIAAAGHPRPVPVAADLTAPDGPARVADAATAALGHVAVLVNNMGNARPTTWDAPEEAWAEGWTLNFDAARRLTTLLLPAMIARQWGRIINLTGTSEPAGTNAAIPAKMATIAWGKGLAKDLGRHGITVNGIGPARIKSEQALTRLYPDPAAREAFAKARIPVGYFGEPEDLAVFAAFLASPRARYINGENVNLDGGMRMFTF